MPAGLLASETSPGLADDQPLAASSRLSFVYTQPWWLSVCPHFLFFSGPSQTGLWLTL